MMSPAGTPAPARPTAPPPSDPVPAPPRPAEGLGGPAPGGPDDRAAGQRHRAIIATSIGNAVEWFDFAVYGFFAAVIGQVFFPAGHPAISLLSSLAVFGVAFLVRPLGGLVIGSLADHKGRRWAMSTTVTVMGVSTVVMGLLPTYDQIGALSPALLILARCAQGFSAGAEWTGSSAFLLEHAPGRRRGLFGSVISATAAVATVAGSATALLLESLLDDAAMQSWGWRLPFLIAGPLALAGLYIRLRIGETPVFDELRASRTVTDQPPRRRPVGRGVRRDRKAIALSFVLASVQGLGFYYLATYAVDFLQQTAALPRTTSLLVSGVGLLVYALACPIAGLAVDTFGRRPVNIAGSTAHLLFAFPAFWLMSLGDPVYGLLGLLLLGLAQSLVSVSTVVLLSELFPAETRSSSSALGFNLGLALIGGPGPLVAAAIADAAAWKPLPAAYLAAVALLALPIVTTLLPETRGKPLGLRPADAEAVTAGRKPPTA